MTQPVFLFWAYMSLTVRTFLLAGLFYAVLWQDLSTSVALAGGGMVAAFGYALKALIGHERQFEACGIGHAMPSMHALITVYFASYYGLCFWRYSKWTWPVLVYRIAAVATYATLVCASRVQLGAGDVLEVLVGAIFGFNFALMLLHALTHVSRRAIPGVKED
jgi:membrane-associated phospholipid phosphatase